MIPGHALGLTEVGDEDLKKALRALHRGELDVPVNITALVRIGLQHCAEAFITQLRGLDEPGVRAVLTCVLAERVGSKR